MNIRTIIEYIYIPGRIIPPAFKVAKSKEEEDKARLEEILSRVASKCKNVKGGALQKSIENESGRIMAMAAAGDLQGALAKAAELESFTDEASTVTKKLDDAILRAKGMLKDLPPEVRGAMKEIIANAERSLHSATDLKDFDGVMATLEMATNLAENVIKGGPDKAAAAMMKLGVLADKVSLLGRDHVNFSDRTLQLRAEEKEAEDKGLAALDDDALGQLAQTELRALPQQQQ